MRSGHRRSLLRVLRRGSISPRTRTAVELQRGECTRRVRGRWRRTTVAPPSWRSTESFVHRSPSESRRWFINDGRTARRDEGKEAMGKWETGLERYDGVKKGGVLRTGLVISHLLAQRVWAEPSSEPCRLLALLQRGEERRGATTPQKAAAANSRSQHKGRSSRN